MWLGGQITNATFPFPQVFSLSPFPLAREPTVTAWRGTTLGRDITNAISLIMPLRFVRRLRNNMAQSLVLYVKSDARYGRRRCGSKSVFEVAQSVYKCAPNMLSVCGKRAVLREKVVIVATSIRVPRTDESHIRLVSLLTAQKIFAISPYTDKCSCHNSADCLLGVGSLCSLSVATLRKPLKREKARNMGESGRWGKIFG